MDSQVQFKINEEEKQILKKAANLLAIGYSTLARQGAIKEARQILINNKMDFKEV